LQRKILSAGHNVERLRFRNAVIENAGYQVVTTKEAPLILELAVKQDFDAIVICSSIVAFLREQIARELKRLRPSVPLIIICDHDCPEDERKRLRHLVNEVVMAPPNESQQPVLDAIKRVVSEPEGESEKRRVQ
jgi:DNA-binding NtrC family response regulator